MAYMYISEYSGLSSNPNGSPIQAGNEPSITTQKITFSTSAQSAAFQPTTHLVRITCDAEAHLAFGSGPTATVADLQVQGDSPEYFTVDPGHQVAAITAA